MAFAAKPPVVLLLSMLLSSCVVQGQTVETWFSIQISTPKRTLSLGPDVKLKLTFVNETDGDLYYVVGVPWRGGPPFDINILDSYGKRVPETPYGLLMQDRSPENKPFAGSVFTATVRPGEKLDEEVNLSKEYDLTRPGKYTIQAIERNPKVKAVKSNLLTITLLP